MSTPLPSRPSLEHLRNDARDLLKAHTSGDPSCCAVLRGLRRFANADDAAILAAEITLQDIQLAVAHQYGVKDWAALKDAVTAAGGAAVETQTAGPSDIPDRLARLDAIVAARSARAWSLRELIAFFKATTSATRGVGLIGIEHVAGKLDDPFLSLGMRIVTEGTDAGVVKAILEERKRTILADHGRRLDVAAAGILGLANGESPMIIDARCRALLPAEAAASSNGHPVPADLESRKAFLDQIVGGGPASRWTTEELIGFFRAATLVAMAGRLVALDGIADKLDDSFVSLGLKLVVDGADVEIVRSILAERKRTLLYDLERRLNLIVAGVNGVAWGENPAVWETRGEAFLPEEVARGGR